MEKFLLLIMVTFASERKENDADNLILVKIEEDEYTKVHKKTSQYIGVSYTKYKNASWRAYRYRRSKTETKKVSNGYYKDEVTAAHASDTLARKLMESGEENLKLNFPDDSTEVHPEEQTVSSNYFGVSFHKKYKLWRAVRWDKKAKKVVSNGHYKDEETAARASDTLARKLIENVEENLKLNFPDDETEVYPWSGTTSSIYIGVCYQKNDKLWCVQRWSKHEKKQVHYGCYKDEEIAARASDTLARKLMANGEHNHKLNFPDDDTEVNTKNQTNKRKRSDHEDLKHSQE